MSNNFKQTNPGDNPADDDGKTERDRELEANQNRGGDRPMGSTGVEKAHGGGSAGLEAATDAMTGFGGAGQPGPRPNNNNPSDPTNPNFGRAPMSDGEARREEYSEPRTTADEELPSKREDREAARSGEAGPIGSGGKNRPDV